MLYTLVLKYDDMSALNKVMRKIPLKNKTKNENEK